MCGHFSEATLTDLTDNFNFISFIPNFQIRIKPKRESEPHTQLNISVQFTTVRRSPAPFQMDRSVRMLGVQPLDRLGQCAKMPSSSLLWRAVLEVIIYTTDIMLAVCVS